MYSNSNNNTGRGSYLGPSSWMPRGWQNNQRPTQTRSSETRNRQSDLSDKFLSRTEGERHLLKMAELSTNQQKMALEIAHQSELLRNLEQTLINNENLVNMQNYLYQANMTIANMVQEMITTYFNQTPKLSDPPNPDKTFAETSSEVLAEVKQTLEQVTEQSKLLNSQTEHLTNIATADSVNLTQDTDSSSDLLATTEQDSDDDVDGNVVDVTTNEEK